MDYKLILSHIQTIAKAHQEETNEYGKKERFLPTGETIPYFFHPLWCSILVLMEPTLSEDMRTTFALALMYHDVLEDTSTLLPDNLPHTVKKYVHELTVPKEAMYNFSSWEKEKDEILTKPINIQLLKLYDKTATLYDMSLKKERINEWSTVVQKLADNVEKEYGTLQIVRIARALTSEIL